jgi:hypothetical protein
MPRERGERFASTLSPFVAGHDAAAHRLTRRSRRTALALSRLSFKLFITKASKR